MRKRAGKARGEAASAIYTLNNAVHEDGTVGPLIDVGDDAVAYWLRLEGDWTLANPCDLQANRCYHWFFEQDGDGHRTLRLGDAFKVPGGALRLSHAPGAVDAVTTYFDGLTHYVVSTAHGLRGLSGPSPEGEE